MTKQIDVGTRVAFSRAFLRSTGQLTGPVPFARGVVREIEDHGNGFVLAFVAWDNMPPSYVNVGNLVRADRIHLEAV